MNHVNYATCCRVVTYNCYSCKIPFKKVSDFKSHLKQKHMLLVCNCCSYSTDKYQSLEQHNEDKHAKDEGFLHCLFCHFLANDWNQIENHIVTTHLCLQFSYYCSNCGFKTTNQNMIKNHLQVNHNTDLKFCFCSLDPELVNTFNNKQSTRSRYNCSICNYKTENHKSLVQHFKDTHWIDFIDDECSEPVCSICDEEIVFENVQEMNEHMSRHDTSVNCNFCQRYL